MRICPLPLQTVSIIKKSFFTKSTYLTKNTQPGNNGYHDNHVVGPCTSQSTQPSNTGHHGNHVVTQSLTHIMVLYMVDSSVIHDAVSTE